MRHLLLLTGLIPSISLGLGVGEKAPEFQLKGSDEQSYSFKQTLAASDAAVVVFVATKCPYSNAYNERYNSLVTEIKKRAPKRVAFFAINSNDTESIDEIKKHAAEKKFLFPVLKDIGHKVADGYRAEKTPEAYLVGPKGDILYHGRIDDDTEGKQVTRRDLLAALDETLSGKPVSVKETKAFGCSIKRQ